jgi:hypothetical protein
MTHESLGPKTGTYEPPSVSKFPKIPNMDDVMLGYNKLTLMEENNKLKELFNKLIYAVGMGNQEEIDSIIKEYRKL